MEILVEFLETNSMIAKGYTKSAQARQLAANKWATIARELNCQGTGANKTPQGWIKYWNDYKSKLKKKAQTMSRIASGTGGGPPDTNTLTQTELRILAILGPSFGMGLPGIAVDPFPGSNTSSFRTTTEPRILEIVSTVTESPALESVPEQLDDSTALDMDEELIHDLPTVLISPPSQFMSNFETVFSTQPAITPEPQLVENPVPTHRPNGRNRVRRRSCVFPSRWAGRWFQSGVIQPIVIDGDRLSNKGKCLSSEGDKFLIVDEKGCYRCVVMHEKHTNVLQYKETFCHRRDALPHLCSLITGDALLYSMFRENALPVECPLKGPFSFTYNRGHGDCKSPVSSIESCTEDSRLLLNYQACPDVHGSESTVEELECLATWKEGSLRFLVGKLHHNHATSNEDRYRCFVYERTNNGIGSGGGTKESGDGVEFRVAQSGDATCNGLFSATEGSRTMALKRVSVRFNCQFPSWMTFSTTWHTLDFSSNYTFYAKNATLRITNQTGADIKVYCVNVKASSPSGNSVALVAHWQHHCASRYVCVVLYRRDTYIAELQRGVPTARPDEACSPHHFNAVTAPYVTLVASDPESKECPYSGKYAINSDEHQRSSRSLHTPSPGQAAFSETELSRRRSRALKRRNLRLKGTRYYNLNVSERPRTQRVKRQEDVGVDSSNGAGAGACFGALRSRLEVGCNSLKNMEFYSICENKELVTAYTCHGGWYEEGASFVVTTPLTRDSTAARRYCFVSREARAGGLHLTRSASNCERISHAHPYAPHATLNATLIGECQDVSSSQDAACAGWPALAWALLASYVITR